jgi:hypothetical protein
MAEVTNEMLYEAALELRAQAKSLCDNLDDCGVQIRAIASHLNATHHDVRKLYGSLLRQDACLTRIEQRLGIGEMTA